MNETGRTILEMLGNGQISVEEAEKLLDALMEKAASQPPVEQKEIPVSGATFVPWPDDGILRIASFVGHRIHLVQDGKAEFRASLEGDIRDVVCYGDLQCGDVEGNANAGGNITCEDVDGNVGAGGNAACSDVDGSVNAGGNVTCGDVDGSVMAGGDIACGDVDGNASAGGDVRCSHVEGQTTSSASGHNAGPGHGFPSEEEWKAMREQWDKQTREFRDQWSTQGKEMADSLRRTAQDMAQVAQHMAKEIGKTVNDNFKNKFK